MLDFFLFSALSLFVIINPFSSIPAFLSITPDDTTAERIFAARKASVIAGIILILFAGAGHYLFKFLGLTISAVQISGGILLFLIALDMMRSPDLKTRLNPIEKEIATDKEDITVTPLAMPLLCGPGAISTVVILQSQAESWKYNVALLAAIPVVYVSCFLVLRFASVHAERLNPIVVRILRRLMGLIFAVIAVQFVIDGISHLSFVSLVGDSSP